MAEELAHDFSIPVAHYDLAYKNGEGKGVISKSFKQLNATYIDGFDILFDYVKNCLYKKSNLLNSEIEDEIVEKIEKYNSLEGIWGAFEYRYLKYPNREKIVSNLINQLVDIFIFDILTGQTDRHEYNWGIVESREDIFLQPLFDNDRLLAMENWFCMTLHAYTIKNYSIEFKERVKKILLEFLTVSSKEFIERLKSKIPFITEENLELVFARIEERTKYPIPFDIKEKVLTNFKTMEDIVKVTLFEYEENKKAR